MVLSFILACGSLEHFSVFDPPPLLYPAGEILHFISFATSLPPSDSTCDRFACKLVIPSKAVAFSLPHKLAPLDSRSRFLPQFAR